MPYKKTLKPNIILIVLDSVRADSLSCYGYKYDTTPTIDSIAKEGIICKNTISNSGWTLPAMASLFTGKLVSHHGTCDHHQFLNDQYPTIAQVLSDNGYETAGFCENSFISRFTGMSRGFKTFHELDFKDLSLWGKILKIKKYFKNKWHNIQRIPNKYCHTTVQFYEIRRWINNTGKNKQPFFLYIHSNQSHYPYIPSKKFRKKFINMRLKKCLTANQDREKYVSGAVTMDRTDFEVVKALYDAELSYLDYQLGKFFAFLKSNNLYNNSMIIITADHGEIFGEHSLIGHGLCLYDFLLRIPLIIRYPRAFSRREVFQQVQLSDILSTIVDVLGIQDAGIISHICGTSIRLLSNDPSFEKDRVAIAEHGLQSMDIFERKIKQLEPEFYRRFRCSSQAIRTNEFKFIWSSNGDNELYNIKEDPGETNNLIEVLPEKAKELQTLLFERANHFEGDETSVVSLTQTSDKEVAKRLKELGYM